MPPFPINIPSSTVRLGSADPDVLKPELYSVYGNQGRGGVGPRPLQPTEGMLKFGAEQQKQQELQTLASQYLGDPNNPDYDGLISAWGQRDPEGALKMGQELEKRRQEAAKTTVEQSKATAAKLDDASLFIKAAIANPSVYPSVRAAAVSKYGDYAEKFLPPVDDPDLETHLGSVLQVMNQHADFVKTRAEAAQLYADGKKVEGVLTNMAGTTTPDQLALAVKDAKMMGLGDVAAQAQDAAGAQAMLAKRQALTPTKESATKLGSFEDYVSRTYGENPTPAQILAARKAYGQADDRALKVSVGAPGSAGPLTQGEGGGLELAGTMMRLTGRVPVGMSRSGLAAQVTNEAARQNKMVGQTPVAMMQKSAVYQGDQKALASLQKQAGAADAYETKALAQLDIVDGLSDQVWRTKSPLINRAILAGQTEIAGDKDATLLLNAIQTASNEYAKIMMGGTASAQALSDSASKEAQKLLNAGMSKGTLKGATQLMRTEMGLTMNGYDAAQKHILENMGGSAGAPQTPQTTPPPSGQTQKIGRFTVTVK
jgi:hypothetical protein